MDVIPMSRSISDATMDTQRPASLRGVSSGDVVDIWTGTPHWRDEAEARLKNALREGMIAGWGSVQKFAEAFELATSDVTKPLNGTEHRHVPAWMIIAVCTRSSGAKLVVECMNDLAGYEPPRLRREFTDAEELAAYREERIAMGSAGDDMKARIAQRLGTRRGALR